MCRWIVMSAIAVSAISIAEADAPAPAQPAPATDTAPTRAELEELTEQNRELREELDLLRDDLQQTHQRIEKIGPIAARLTGYIDFGFFYVRGTGAGIRSDIGHIVYPKFEGVVPDSWVFMGDPLSTAVNARGEPATTGESRAIVFDSIKSKGPSFILSSLNVGVFTQVGSSTVVTAKFDVVPRGRDVSSSEGLFLGDYVDVRLAYLEHRISRKGIDLELFAGKFDSVIGFEYRSQEAPTRIEVTPSLICRYTCGSPLGLKARAQFADKLLGLNVAVTNGTSFVELFPFYDEIDRNKLKTGSGRLHIAPARGLELGVSGLYGAQDQQDQDSTRQWMYGVDVHYHRHDLVLRAEFVHGFARGRTSAPIEGMPDPPLCDEAPCLEFKGAYGLVGYRVTNLVMPYVRIDWRDALHRSGASFVYVSEVARLTTGLRLTLTPNLVVKGEYTLNRELGEIADFYQIPNDVFTSSLVVTY